MSANLSPDNATPSVTPKMADPWDAPYFGAPVYLRFPDHSTSVKADGVSPGEMAPATKSQNDGLYQDYQEATPHATQAPPAPVSSQVALARRNWLARLFRAR